MSKRSDLLLSCILGNRWRATSAPSAGTTSVASSPAVSNALQRPNLETLWYSIRNFVGAGGVAATVQVQVRHASIAGTLIASVDHIVPASTTANVAISDLAIAGKRGSKLFVSMNTVVASLTQSVNIAGWIEDDAG